MVKFGIYILILEGQWKNWSLNSISGYVFGWGNGYILLPKEHPWYGKDYDNIPVNIHGGLTFGEKFNYEYFPKWIEDRNFYGDINLDNYKEFNDYWIIGFDTAHSGDNSSNCSKSFVISETDNLLNQCLNDDIQEIKKYKSKFLRKSKLNNINTSVLALSSKQ